MLFLCDAKTITGERMPRDKMSATKMIRTEFFRFNPSLFCLNQIYLLQIHLNLHELRRGARRLRN